MDPIATGSAVDQRGSSAWPRSWGWLSASRDPTSSRASCCCRRGRPVAGPVRHDRLTSRVARPVGLLHRGRPRRRSSSALSFPTASVAAPLPGRRRLLLGGIAAGSSGSSRRRSIAEGCRAAWSPRPGRRRGRTSTGVELAWPPGSLTGLGRGLLGSCAAAQRGTRLDPATASYESARRLLAQLRPSPGELSSGLDPVSMAGQILTTTHDATAVRRQPSSSDRGRGAVPLRLPRRRRQPVLARRRIVEPAERAWQPSSRRVRRRRTASPAAPARRAPARRRSSSPSASAAPTERAWTG